MEENTALITNDAVVFGILMIILALVFGTAASKRPFWKRFYSYVPLILLCYFIPAVLNSLGVIDGEKSNLYFVASRYLLPTSLVLLTLSIDLKEIMKLGNKSVIMFLTGTVGIVLGGPLAVLIVSTFSPETVGGQGPEEVWRGLATVAGSWIGGGANQAAMFEIFGASTDLFSSMITVDVLVANLWMAILLYGAGRADRLDAVFKADSSAIEEVRRKIEEFRASVSKIPNLGEVMVVLGVGFAITGLSHLVGNYIAPIIQKAAPQLDRFSLTSPFFWLIVIATTAGLILSFTRVRNLEGVGASRYGSVLLYILVATIGARMDITAIVENPGLFIVGGIWMLVHITLLLSVAKIIKAPFFFTAVGSQANVGGAASAPIVAAAFNPALAPVGVLLAVLGYAIGTYAAWFCGILMQAVSP